MLARSCSRNVAMAALLATCLTGVSAAQADEADAKAILKKMSEYVGSQDRIAFDYDADLGVVTDDGQKLALASSGTVTLVRPDHLRFKRSAGFADMDMMFDGKTLTLFGAGANVFANADVPGSIDELVETIRDEYYRPLPAADLLSADSYDVLMDGVTDVKDLGSGVVGGQECDTFAFRKEDVDFQIWIAHGDRPYPCRFTITSKTVEHSPQYTIQLRNWESGDAVEDANFTFENTTGAEEIAMAEVTKRMSELPENFQLGEAK